MQANTILPQYLHTNLIHKKPDLSAPTYTLTGPNIYNITQIRSKNYVRLTENISHY